MYFNFSLYYYYKKNKYKNKKTTHKEFTKYKVDYYLGVLE